MNKKCKYCQLEITKLTAAYKNGNLRNECKPCRVKVNVKHKQKSPEEKMSDCETCGKKCTKKFSRAFCSDICKFMAYVEKTDSCWIWNGTIKQDGYGTLMVKTKWVRAHRHSYELFNEPIKKEMIILHSCHTPKCVNPEHLKQGTPQDNTNDMMLANRWNGGRPPNR